MKKRIAAVAMAVILSAGAVLPANSYNFLTPSITASGEEYGGFSYELLENGTVGLKEYRGNKKEITLPSEIKGRTVTRIMESCFEDKKGIVSVTIPDTVTEIEHDAFAWCYDLEMVYIPDSVTVMGSAFSRCPELKEVRLSDNIEEIARFCFIGCTSLEKIKLPRKLKTIGASAFQECTALKSISIPDSTEEIGYEAFSHCTALKSIKLPKKLKTLSRNSFGYCESLKKITLNEKNKYFTVLDNMLLDKKKTVLYTVPRNKEKLTVPKTVKKIGDWAFSGCKRLKSITLPPSVREIGECSFAGCTSLTRVKLSEKLEQVGFKAFFNCMELKSVTVPKGVQKLYRGAFGLYYDEEKGDWDSCAVVPGFKIKCYKGSKGDEYAELSGIECEYII